jgi:hypothetical protein
MYQFLQSLEWMLCHYKSSKSHNFDVLNSVIITRWRALEYDVWGVTLAPYEIRGFISLQIVRVLLRTIPLALNFDVDKK